MYVHLQAGRRTLSHRAVAEPRPGAGVGGGKITIREQFLTAQPGSFSAEGAQEQWSCLFLTDRPLISGIVL